ncbi:MAG: hypothetical protein ACPLPQ_02525 [Candidatus Saccharicenans sp.]
MLYNETQAKVMRKMVEGKHLIKFSVSELSDSFGQAARLFRLSVSVLALLTGLLVFQQPALAQAENFSAENEGKLIGSWLGPEFYASQLEDWRLSSGKIECLTGATNRYVYFLTEEIDPAGHTLEISFRAAVPAWPEKVRARNYLGLRLGIKAESGDFRQAAVRGQGIDVGLTTDGLLFIGELESVSPEETLESIKKALKREVEFRLKLKKEAQAISLTVLVVDPSSGKVLDELQDVNVQPEKISGGLALVCSLPEAHPSGSGPVSEFYDLKTEGDMLKIYPERTFGPVAFTFYTLSQRTLRLTAQLIPGCLVPGRRIFLETKVGGSWKTISESRLNSENWQAYFQVPGWESDRDAEFRVRVEESPGEEKFPACYGVVRKQPWEKEKLRLALLSQNHEQNFPNLNLVSNLKAMEPDLLVFAGNQIFGRPPQFWREKFSLKQARLEYFRQWLWFGWAFSDLLKDRPAVLLPDARDFFQMKLWGEGGKMASGESGADPVTRQDSGGFLLPEEFVRLVLSTQTSHLPPPDESQLSEKTIFSGFYCLNYAGLSLAVINDRISKSAPAPLLPRAQIRNGWPLNPEFDPRKEARLKEARLLSEEQLRSLEKWVLDWTEGTWMKAALSCSSFVSLLTLPEGQTGEEALWQLRPLKPGEYPASDRAAADFNSSGWPQPARDEIIRLLRKARAVHLSSSGGPPALLKYGLDRPGDAVAAMVTPAIQATFALRWTPRQEAVTTRGQEVRPLSNQEDAFGNKFSLLTVNNAAGQDQISGLKSISGFGLVTFEKRTRKVIFESYRLGEEGTATAELMPGWPVVVGQLENDGRKPVGFLPLLRFKGISDPVIQVVEEKSGELIYSFRITGTEFRPPVYQAGVYSVKCGEPGTDKWKEYRGLKPQPETVRKTLVVDFTSSPH